MQQRAAEGHGGLVAIVGEAGVGKSRLVYEFTHSDRVRDWQVHEAASFSYGTTTSYLPVIDLLKGYFKIQDRDDRRQIRDNVIGRVLALDRSLEPVLSPLLALLDLTVDDSRWEALDPPQRRQRTLEAVKRLLLRESETLPLVLVIEDLHWVDTETQALLDALVHSLGSARLLLVVTYRPEFQHLWPGNTHHTQIRLDALPTEGTRNLLEALLGDDPGLAELKQLLVKRGNPFFLEETVRTLVETKALVGERGRYRLAQPVEAIRVPPTVQAMLAARIDRLSPEDKRLLQVAAVIGRDIPVALLQGVADSPQPELRDALSRLRAREFLYELRLYPDLEYTFKHALTHEVAYGSLLQTQRCSLHAKTVTATEELYADRLDEQVERVAHHAVRGEMWEKAVSYLHRSGGKAFARSANRQAAAYYEQALSVLGRLPESRDTMQLAMALRFDQRNALQLLGQIPKSIETLREAERIARVLDDQRWLAIAWAYLSNSVWMAGRSSEARVLSRDAVAAATSLDDAELIVATNIYLGGACLTCGDLQGALSCHREVLRRLAGGLGRRRSSAMTGFAAPIAQSGVAMALAERGQFVDALAEGQQAVRVAESLDHPHTLAWACWGLATVHLWRGDLAAALAVVDRAFAVAREWELGLWFAYLNWYRGRVCTLSGRVTEGLTLLQESLKIYAERKSGTWEALAVAHLSEALALAGRIEAAVQSARRALELSQERGERSHEAHALLSIGRIASEYPDPNLSGAETHLRRALGLGGELGMRPLVAHCHLGLGRLFRRTDTREQATEHLTMATTMYREMGMTYWLDKAEAEARELG
jgi:tetratricopeptide (TPR) repeat protein